jgi:hypothetical protein
MGANWGCERKGDAAATCTVQRAHSSTAVPLAGCGTSLCGLLSCPWVHGPFMPVCSTGGASVGDPRRSRPAQRAVRGGGRPSQSSKSCITRRPAARCDSAEFTMVMESVTKPQNAYQRHGFWRGEALVPGTDGGPSATQAFAFCFIGSTAFRNKCEGRRART